MHADAFPTFKASLKPLNMATYSSKAVTVPVAPATISDKFSDFTNFQGHLDALPADQRAKVGDIKFTRDSIVMNTPQVGAITLKVTERTPNRVALTAVGSPVPMNLIVDLRPVDGGEKTEFVTSMDVDIPAMLKPMVGGTMQKAVDQFGELMKKLV